MNVKGKRGHVRSAMWPGRLVCGRRDPGVRLVGIDRAEEDPELCSKCRQRLGWERQQIAYERAPKPGVQKWFDFII